jgi:hypothetical protein
MGAVNSEEYKIDFDGIFGHSKAAPSADSDFLDFRGLAARLGTSEQWVRRNVRRTYTRDPIPHLRFGRLIRFVWDSPDAGVDRETEDDRGRHKKHRNKPSFCILQFETHRVRA